MFDEVCCKRPLPGRGVVEAIFQTKDTPHQLLDLFEIRADGTLWHQDYDIEDRSDPNAEGLARIVGCMTRINHRWEPMTAFTGTIDFYTALENDGWLEYRSEWKAGELVGLSVITDDGGPIHRRSFKPLAGD